MLAPTASTMLRSGVARSCCSGLQPILLRSTSAVSSACSSYSTLGASSPLRLGPKLLKPSSSPISAARVHRPCSKRSISSGPANRSSPKRSTVASLLWRRQASTTTSAAQQDAQAAAAASARATKAHPELPPLDWNTFFQLRKTRRRIQLVCSIMTCGLGGTAGALFLSSGAADIVVNQIPLDPFVTLGLMTFGFAALGWLAGPSLGSMIFYAWKSKYRAQMTLKESQFFARIKKNRVDPSASSAGNPVPDFYGEKIQSVAGYRQWLKDQRAFNKKRTTFV